MANWYGTARSNAFRVKDEDAFREDMVELAGLEVHRREPADASGEHGPRFVLLEPHGEGWPSPTRPVYDEAGDLVREEEVDLFDLVAGHLAEGEVAVFVEAGAEKHRYVTGTSVAVNDKGESLAVHLDDIYEKVERAGWPRPARAAY